MVYENQEYDDVDLLHMSQRELIAFVDSGREFYLGLVIEAFESAAGLQDLTDEEFDRREEIIKGLLTQRAQEVVQMFVIERGMRSFTYSEYLQWVMSDLEEFIGDAGLTGGRKAIQEALCSAVDFDLERLVGVGVLAEIDDDIYLLSERVLPN